MVAYNLPNKAPISELKGFRKAKSKNLKMNFWAFSFNSRILHTKNRSCLVKYQTKVTTSQGLYLVLHFSHFGYIIRTIFFLLLYKARKYKSKNRLKSFSKNLTFEIPIEFKIGSAFSFIIPTRKNWINIDPRSQSCFSEMLQFLPLILWAEDQLWILAMWSSIVPLSSYEDYFCRN